MPDARSRASKGAVNEKPVIVFPASTVGRKGCYELRDAIRDLSVKLILLGPMIEGSNFWDGFDIERGPTDWLERADVVVLPAFVEHRPRRLLLAARAGIPVIATDACGVAGIENVITVEHGDVASLRKAIVGQLPF
jgi:glycosyltransferase involved in cell wall biosynthesis